MDSGDWLSWEIEEEEGGRSGRWRAGGGSKISDCSLVHLPRSATLSESKRHARGIIIEY